MLPGAKGAPAAGGTGVAAADPAAADPAAAGAGASDGVTVDLLSGGVAADGATGRGDALSSANAGADSNRSATQALALRGTSIPLSYRRLSTTQRG